jgi:putative holliday junction resolvase
VGKGLDHKEEILTLLDEDGIEHSFEVIDILQVNERDYAILLPLDAGQTMDSEARDDEAIIFRIEEEGEENQTLMAVEDEEEWEQVAAAWEERVREWDDEDEDEDEDGVYLEDEEEEV